MRSRARMAGIGFGVLVATLCLAQAPQITVEQIHNKQVEDVAKVPDVDWLDDGTAIIYDNRVPELKRTFERFDPKTGTRTPILDMMRALASLQALNHKPGEPSDKRSDREEKILEWPEEFDRAGTNAVYLIGNDVFLLHLASSSFERVTNTPAEEKAPHFSPDGRKLAFVRDYDLYLYDLATKKEQRLTSDGTPNLLNGALTWVYWEEIFGRSDTGYWWSPDSHSIAYLQTDLTGVPVDTFVDRPC